MSTNGTPLTLNAAHILAEKVLLELVPACERIEVAGSIRRGKALVRDLELVAIPNRVPNLFGEPGESELDPVLEKLVAQGAMELLKGGDKYKQFLLVKAGIKLDLFLCNAETWGMCYLIRTGPEDFSKRVVTQRSKGGMLPSQYFVRDLRIWYGTEALQTREEKEVFQILGMKFIAPEKR